MAATNYTPISIYYSATASATPTAGNLVAGELALNTNDGKLFYKDSSGVVQTLATKGGVGTSSTTQVLYNSSGLVVGSAGLTFDGTNLATTGTATATRFIPSGSTIATNGLYLPAANSLGFSTNSTEAMRITSAGNVGIGTSSPVTLKSAITAQVFGNIKIGNDNGAGLLSLGDTASSGANAGVWRGAAGAYGSTGNFLNLGGYDGITFTTGNFDIASQTERMRINSSGNVGIGTSSPSVASGLGLVLDGAAGQARLAFKNTTSGSASTDGFQIGIDAAAEAFIEQRENLPLRFSTNATEAMRITSAGNVGIGSAGPVSKLEVVNSGVATLYIGYNNTSFNYLDADNNIFRNGAGTERMRIDSSGNLLVGRTSQFSNGQYSADFGGNTKRGATYNNTDANTGANFVSFGSSGTVIGTISQNGSSAVLYNTTSDQRLKENIVDAPSGNINDIKVRSFDWIADGSHQTYGMVAQELVEVAPYAVHQPQNLEEMMAVDYSKLVPMMIKEIQDLKQRIATLENK